MATTIKRMSPDLILSTVNAPYRHQMEAAELVHCLLHPDAAKASPGHMSSFFGDVVPELQIYFAEMFGITRAQLIAAAQAFEAYSGQPCPLSKWPASE